MDLKSSVKVVLMLKMKNQETNRQVIVPNHAKDLKKGLEQEILKQAGLK